MPDLREKKNAKILINRQTHIHLILFVLNSITLFLRFYYWSWTASGYLLITFKNILMKKHNIIRNNCLSVECVV